MSFAFLENVYYNVSASAPDMEGEVDKATEYLEEAKALFTDTK